MITLKDKPGDVWAYVYDMDTVGYEDGTTKPLETSDCILTFWNKYKGRPFSEISDEKDLKFLLKVSVEKDLLFVQHCVKLRQLELS